MLLSCTQLADVKLPNLRCINVAMLGLLSPALPFPRAAWLTAIRNAFPPKLQDMNIAAFDLGRAAAAG